METKADYKPLIHLEQMAMNAMSQELTREADINRLRDQEMRDAKSRRLARVVRGIAGDLASEAFIGWEQDDLGLNVDGIRFTLEMDRWGEEEILVIWGQCPVCHNPAHSPSIYTLAQLGEYISSFVVDGTHRCPQPEPEPGPEQDPEPTWEENMLELVEKGIEGRDSGEIYARPADYFLQVIAEALVRLAAQGGAA
jgi:hypothetical protein